MEGILDVDVILRRFVDLVPDAEELRRRAETIVNAFKETRICRYLNTHPCPVRYLMHKLDKPGIFDTLAGVKRGETIGANRDYGLISVIKNPFSENDHYSALCIAGVHGPGTALGLRLLANKHAFKHHPFGGVYEVNLDRFAHFFEKFQASSERWETVKYDESTYGHALVQVSAKSIKVFLSSPAPKVGDEQRIFNETIKTLVNRACGQSNLRLEIEGPYTLPMGGGTDFWDNILAWEKDCSFVIHDVTDCRPGVLVELGFTIGNRKQHFLIWNSHNIRDALNLLTLCPIRPGIR